MYISLHSDTYSRVGHPARASACLLKCLGVISALTLYGWYVLPFSIEAPELPAPAPHHQETTTSVESQYSELLIEATLAAEDKRFYHHGGVDLCANVRAIKDALEAKRFVSGASTITQQTVKLLSKTPPRTLETKLTEALAARHLEMRHDKAAILSTYFGLLEYGNRTRGPAQAAAYYFNKDVHELSLAEAALLAGLPQAPSRLNPRKNPKSALKRRNWVLERMHIVYGYTEQEISQAQAEPLGLVTPKTPRIDKLALKQSL